MNPQEMDLLLELLQNQKMAIAVMHVVIFMESLAIVGLLILAGMIGRMK